MSTNEDLLLKMLTTIKNRKKIKILNLINPKDIN